MKYSYEHQHRPNRKGSGSELRHKLKHRIAQAVKRLTRPDLPEHTRRFIREDIERWKAELVS